LIIFDYLTFENFETFIELFASRKEKLIDKETENGIDNLQFILNVILKIENQDSKREIKENKNGLEMSLESFFKKEYTNLKLTSKEGKTLADKLIELKFKISQLLKFLRLKKVFNQNALIVDLKDMDYENLNVNAIIEIFIVKKFNIDLINDINDFYSKTTDIREAIGLNWDDFLIELSYIFYKYKMNNMYANILMVQINEYLSNKNKIGLSVFNEKNINNKTKIYSISNINKSKCGDFDKSEFFLYLDYNKNKDENNKNNYQKLKNNYCFKKGFNPEEEYLILFKDRNNIKDNFHIFLNYLNENLDIEKFNNSRHLKGEIEDRNNTYSFHPKLIELLNNINYNFRGKEFKLNTNINMKSKLYTMILSRNYCAVENILQWENFSFDLKNLKQLKFLEKTNSALENNKIEYNENYLVVTNEDEKIFYLFNLLSLIYTGKDKKYDLIFDNLSNIFVEKFESLLNYSNEENDYKKEIQNIKSRLILFIMDSIYSTLKNTKAYTFSNLLFWRTFISKLSQKILTSNSRLKIEKLKELERIIKEILKELLHFNTYKKTINYSERIIEEKEFFEISKESDFIFESINKISYHFNILLLFGEEFFEKFDFKNKIRNSIFKHEIEEYSNKYFYFKTLIKILKNHLQENKRYSNSKEEFYYIFIVNIFKNLNMVNIFTFIKLLDMNVLIKIFNFEQISILKSKEVFNLRHLLGIKLLNNISNISAFIFLDQSLSFFVFNYIKSYIETENEFKELLDELLYIPKFNILLDASSNIILLEKNLNQIVKDYFETKINIINQITNLFKDKFLIGPIAETTFKLIKIKKFICNSFYSNLRNVFSDISEINNYLDLENYIKDERLKKEIYKIFSQLN